MKAILHDYLAVFLKRLSIFYLCLDDGGSIQVDTNDSDRGNICVWMGDDIDPVELAIVDFVLTNTGSVRTIADFVVTIENFDLTLAKDKNT
ncbi:MULTISPECIES: hypothetical protein [Brevibacillus]|uniref:hypothetical protein n=1 Tax=Brevibacillus TaxID=55080 RepID=UPI0004F2423B|nr:hypothetical protein [Brevibacillus borstelensis]KKX53622.1 hypothetical protein X546_18370 [Brevibacillus borstelensis cifa_chp40]MED1743991.1 hypothetical protein [Brevibacillus borstelensis]MED2010297.1 hypothetical protein [Brevibacillus borstelensis]